jgi:hypothetical protein
VFIRDVAAGKLALYVDDVKVADAALAPGAAGALHNDDGEADPLTIGAQITGGSSAPELFFNGLIDDVKLFDTAAYPGATPTNTTAPAISGTPASGQTLTCSNGGWSNGPTSFTYQWNRDGTPIPGATGQTYVVQTADEGHSLTCTVTAANAAGSAPATSSPLAIPGGITGEQLPRVVNAGQLFCGVRHHGHCNGIPDKTEFSSPGNAVWTFGAYGTAGKAGIARTSAVVVVLGTVRRTITHAGTVRFAFKLTGAKAGRLYAEVKRKHLDVLRIKLRFTPKGGKPTTLVRSLKLKF